MVDLLVKKEGKYHRFDPSANKKTNKLTIIDKKNNKLVSLFVLDS